MIMRRDHCSCDIGFRCEVFHDLNGINNEARDNDDMIISWSEV